MLTKDKYQPTMRTYNAGLVQLLGVTVLIGDPGNLVVYATGALLYSVGEYLKGTDSIQLLAQDTKRLEDKLTEREDCKGFGEFVLTRRRNLGGEEWTYHVTGTSGRKESYCAENLDELAEQVRPHPFAGKMPVRTAESKARPKERTWEGKEIPAKQFAAVSEDELGYFAGSLYKAHEEVESLRQIEKLLEDYETQSAFVTEARKAIAYLKDCIEESHQTGERKNERVSYSGFVERRDFLWRNLVPGYHPSEIEEQRKEREKAVEIIRETTTMISAMLEYRGFVWPDHIMLTEQELCLRDYEASDITNWEDLCSHAREPEGLRGMGHGYRYYESSASDFDMIQKARELIGRLEVNGSHFNREGRVRIKLHPMKSPDYGERFVDEDSVIVNEQGREQPTEYHWNFPWKHRNYVERAED